MNLTAKSALFEMVWHLCVTGTNEASVAADDLRKYNLHSATPYFKLFWPKGRKNLRLDEVIVLEKDQPERTLCEWLKHYQKSSAKEIGRQLRRFYRVVLLPEIYRNYRDTKQESFIVTDEFIDELSEQQLAEGISVKLLSPSYYAIEKTNFKALLNAILSS